MNSRGITLTELVIAVAVLMTLMAIVFSFQGWMRRYNVERAIRELHGDLLRARQIALAENRVVCVTFGSNSYTIRKDTDPSPDGDGDCDDSGDMVIVQRTASFVLSNNFNGSTFNFQRDGLADRNGHIRIEEDAYLNCIDIFSTRINLGEWNGNTSDPVCIVK